MRKQWVYEKKVPDDLGSMLRRDTTGLVWEMGVSPLLLRYSGDNLKRAWGSPGSWKRNSQIPLSPVGLVWLAISWKSFLFHIATSMLLCVVDLVF